MDWISWHHEYENPDSRLSRRLRVVQDRLGQIAAGAAGVSILSLCAGDSRDLIPVLAAHRELAFARVVAVELDPVVSRRAGQMAATAGLQGFEARCGDAGDVNVFGDCLPVDLLLLCGVFGNIEHPTVQAVVHAVPAMVNSGGHVIWTRGAGQGVDHRQQIRQWFVDAGMPEVVFDGAPEAYGVGVNRIPEHVAKPLPAQLFTFMA